MRDDGEEQGFGTLTWALSLGQGGLRYLSLSITYGPFLNPRIWESIPQVREGLNEVRGSLLSPVEQECTHTGCQICLTPALGETLLGHWV